MRGSSRLKATLVAAAVLAGACGRATPPQPSPEPASPPPTTPSPVATPTADDALNLGTLRIRLEQVTSDVTDPLFLTHAGDGSGQRYVVEQGGTIRVLDADDQVRSAAFLDISDRLTAGGEQGLLGLAFDPENPLRFFVNYTDLNGDTVIAEYRAESPTRAQRASERVLLRVDQPEANHNGGMLSFGPDGALYIGTGDGGGAGDPQGNGQSLESLLGKILRLDVSGKRAASPRDNPFVGKPGRDEIFHYGLRNPWRFSFDRESGNLWIGDVGQGALEEIDLALSGKKGLNFGWNLMEGRECFTQNACDGPDLQLPVAQYPTIDGCAVTGGYVYRGEAFPEARGAYFFGDYCGGQIWAVSAEAAKGGEPRKKMVLQTSLNISSFGEDEAGELYVTDLGGGIHRIVPG